MPNIYCNTFENYKRQISTCKMKVYCVTINYKASSEETTSGTSGENGRAAIKQVSEVEG
jgi:hypothetical protein